MRYYPINLDLQGQKAVVVGGGVVAVRKVQGLLQAGACVVVVAPQIHAWLKKPVARGAIQWIRRRYRSGDLKGAIVVIGATGNHAVDLAMSKEAARHRIPLNIIDLPALCTFTVPARVVRGELLVTLSTGGASPALAKRLRQQIERLFGPEYTSLTRLLSRIRHKKNGGILDRGRVRRLTQMVKGL